MNCILIVWCKITSHYYWYACLNPTKSQNVKTYIIITAENVRNTERDWEKNHIYLKIPGRAIQIDKYVCLMFVTFMGEYILWREKIKNKNKFPIKSHIYIRRETKQMARSEIIKKKKRLLNMFSNDEKKEEQNNKFFFCWFNSFWYHLNNSQQQSVYWRIKMKQTNL